MTAGLPAGSRHTVHQPVSNQRGRHERHPDRRGGRSRAARIAAQAREDRRLSAGHLWVFSNEVDTARTPLSGFATGALCRVVGDRDRFLGYAYVNPHALICARILGRDPEYPPGESLIVHRLQVALALRERLYATPFYRLVYGESDGLPGLVLDRYGDVVVGQIGTAGMEALKDEVVAALDKVIAPAALVWKNDSGARELEGLPSYVETALGTAPSHVWIEENGVRFRVPIGSGQKTGWFYDQAANRRSLRALRQRRARARRLQLPRRAGVWRPRRPALREVVCVDSSAARSSSCSCRPPRTGSTSGRFATMRSMRWRRCARPARSSTSSCWIRRPSSSASATCRKAPRRIAS